MTATNHRTRLDGVVKAAVMQTGFGESFGYYVECSIMPTPQGLQPGWLIGVSIRDGLADEPIALAAPLPGLLPPDDQFRTMAQALLSQCRDERDRRNAAAVEGADKELKAITEGRR